MTSRMTGILSITALIAFGAMGCGPHVYPVPDSGPDWSPEDLIRVTKNMSVSIKKSRFVRSPLYITGKPRWILARDMANDTDEHINTRVIMEKIRTQLIRSKKRPFRFIDDQALQDILNQLSLQQSALFDQKKTARIGKLVGAKLILRGRISNIRRRSKRSNYVFYNITLQAVSIETSEILWTDEDEISRRTTKSRFR
ncbi:MAG: hypothetical protein IEMM0008_1847 [bacterium]|nr:MAG: hypothetical protein IEMM0008_1847 [bacterium]